MAIQQQNATKPVSGRGQTVPTLNRTQRVCPAALKFRPALLTDHPWPARCMAQVHMGSLQKVVMVALFVSCLAANAGGTVTEHIPSPNELIVAGKYQLAADTLVQALREATVPGQQDENTGALLANLGLVYEKLGRYPEAEATLGKAIGIYRDLDLTESQNYARAMNNLGNVYVSEKRYTKSEETFKDILALYRSHMPENYQDIATILNNIGLTRLLIGDAVTAEHFFRESLELQRRVKEETQGLAVTLNNIALACRHQARLEEAARIYAQANDVWRNTLGPTHPEVAVGLHNLASVEARLGQDEAAEKHFKEALALVDATLPAEHPTRTAILGGYADLLLKMGHKHEAKQMQASVRLLRARHDHQNFQDLTVDVRQLQR